MTRQRTRAKVQRNNNEDDPNMEQLFEDIKDYIDLKFKAFKLSIVDNLSQFLGKALSIVLVILLAQLAVILFAGALTVLVYQWVGSLLWAFVIMGGFFVILAVVIYLLREKLFANSMVRTFVKMFFGNKNNEEDDYYE